MTFSKAGENENNRIDFDSEKMDKFSGEVIKLNGDAVRCAVEFLMKQLFLMRPLSERIFPSRFLI
jgi:hypothetical protein